MTFDINGPLMTRDGRKARLIASDIQGPSPLCVAVATEKDGDKFVESVHLYRADGTYFVAAESSLDLRNGPVETWVYRNFGEAGFSGSYDSSSAAIHGRTWEDEGILRFRYLDGKLVNIGLAFTYGDVVRDE